MKDDAEYWRWAREILIGRFEIPEDRVGPDARLREDLGLESIDMVDLVLELERRLGHRFENEDISGVRTVRDVVALLERLRPHPVG